MIANIAGPVCESGDTFAMGRDIDRVVSGDLAIFRTAGAYGATMASTYNSRALVPEVLVSGDKFAVVADRIAAGKLGCRGSIGDRLDPENVQAAEFGDLLEAERSIVDQPRGGRMRHERLSHGETFPQTIRAAPSRSGLSRWAI
jgi:hypothetical protein